jgi:hypothetical protein
LTLTPVSLGQALGVGFRLLQGRPARLAVPVTAVAWALYVTAIWYWPNAWETGFQRMIWQELAKW